jgi:PDZ domain-containing protein
VWWLLGPVLFLMVVAATVGAFVPAPYVAYAPGSARDTGPLIVVPDGTGHPSEGDIFFLTVSVVRPSYLQALLGWLQSDVDVYPREVVFGDRSDEESRTVNLQLMDISKLVAARVAFEELGCQVDVSGTGVLVVGVIPDVPADEAVDPGDVITAVGDDDVHYDAELIEAIQARQPGDRVRLRIEPAEGGPSRMATTTLIKNPQDPDLPLLGVDVQTRDLRYDFPLDVSIRSGAVGGPSAGLAFALGLIDRLTPGSLTGGRPVAVTGEISEDGTVADVGGVAQKAVAARDAGAEVFLVPPAEVAAAEPHAGDMQVVPVGTLDDALRALSRLGGNTSALDPPEGLCSGV